MPPKKIKVKRIHSNGKKVATKLTKDLKYIRSELFGSSVKPRKKRRKIQTKQPKTQAQITQDLIKKTRVSRDKLRRIISK